MTLQVFFYIFRKNVSELIFQLFRKSVLNNILTYNFKYYLFLNHYSILFYLSVEEIVVVF